MKHYNISIIFYLYHSVQGINHSLGGKMKLMFQINLMVIFTVINTSIESEDKFRVLRLEDIMPNPLTNVTYDKSKPPTFRAHPAIVFMHITVLMLDSFDQNEMTFTSGKKI